MAREMQERMQAEGVAPPEPTIWQKLFMGDQTQQQQQHQQPDRFIADFDDE
jgi:hypothetical protein